jgi:predicted nucleic-acid-binding protein
MEVVDANVILRYLLGDIDELYRQAEKIFAEAINGKRKLFIPQSVVAEVVYVLSKVYKVPKGDIASAISFLLELKNCKVQDGKVVKTALEIYQSENLSFVDSLLCAYSKVNGFGLLSLDKELLKKCRKGKGGELAKGS